MREVAVHGLDGLLDEGLRILRSVQLVDLVLVERDQRDEVRAPVADDQRL
jgi:hypothetical protein